MENKIISYLTFRIGSEIFGTNVKNVQNIIEYSEITKVPKMPSFILGVSNLRGKVLPIIDSRIKLGLPNSKFTSNTCIIVLELLIEGQEINAGLLVDEVLEVLEIEDKDINAAPSIGTKYKTDIVTGVYPVFDKFIMILDITMVVYSEELLSV